MVFWDGGVPISWETSKMPPNFAKPLPAAYDQYDAIYLGIRGFRKVWDVG